ncbi:LOW QUALITY PROTEIN: inaD-like protein [Trematomus bernacchii]|uniref:LOW QUALITY PROTEIN: inaD-like protein n=1 Tax=Trematomus bernacchii TaxID=40690 RepID=UPI00146BBF49|nr:LOW QUALITY PROTEIN: inaD-like protein [Trematomus bernacchii]
MSADWSRATDREGGRTMFENVPAASSAERQQVLGALERLQAKLLQREEWTHSETMGNLRETLQSPLFSHILTLQHSIKQLRSQLSSMPPEACSEFSFSKKGQLIMSAVDPVSSSSSLMSTALSPPIRQTPPSSEFNLQKWILVAAKGLHIEVCQLTRPLSGGLGFSVVGLNPAGSSSQGVFVKQIQHGGIAHRDGRLQERDQILVINGSPLEPGISHQQALALLQQPGETVELVVARDRPLNAASSQPAAFHTDEWGHVEEIQLVNDGSGLGFGIVGGKTAGVVVRTLIPNSVAAKDGRLRTGDHILRIGATPTSGLTSDQVVNVLQGCGSHVTLLISRDPQGQKSTAPPPPPPPASAPVSSLPPRPPGIPPQRRPSKTPNLEGYEVHEVPLTKNDGQSLGISIIGYNTLTSQDAVGVFVKHVVPGSAADQSGNIQVHDRLLALNGVSLHGMNNQEVLEVMKKTGQTVLLSVVRKKPITLERSLDKARDAELWAKWEQALGPNYQVLVVKLDPVIEDDAELQKILLLPVHTLRLGVELDSFDGHHYISSVVPGGPVEKHGVLRPEDELLEVNDVQLYGKSRREVVAFLKEVPPPFTLVCCRHPTSELGPESESESEPGSDPVLQPGPMRQSKPSVDEIELKLSSMLCTQTEKRQSATVQEQALKQESPGEEELMETQHSQEEEEEEEEEQDEDEDEGELAQWSPDVQVLELQKERDKGLGFSILDYQDPLDPGRCVMVIRSLVAGGSADRLGALLPGDQLVSVNHTQLDLLTLGQAVEVLKSAPPGRVRLGIRKASGGGGRGTREEQPGVSQHTPACSKGLRLTAPILPEDLLQKVGNRGRRGARAYPGRRSASLHLLLPGLCGGEHGLVTQETSSVVGGVEAQLLQLGGSSRGDLEQRGSRRSSATGRKRSSATGRKRRTCRDLTMTALCHQHKGFRTSETVEADSELTLTDTDTESIRLINSKRRKRRSQGGASLPMRGGHGDLPEREDGEGEETPAFSHWGLPRRVEVWPEEGQSLGLSIVGGHQVIKRLKNGEELKGIFIKQVLKNSPAAKTQCLKTGDKILEVSGVDLRVASHEEAVNAIKSAPSPVVFIVQSLSTTPRPVSLTAPSYKKHKSTRTESPVPAPPPLRQLPPYRPPSHSDQELNSDLEQAKGLV